MDAASPARTATKTTTGNSSAPAGPGTAAGTEKLLGEGDLLPGVPRPKAPENAARPAIGLGQKVRELVRDSQRTEAPVLRPIVERAVQAVGEARTKVDEIFHGG